jgi:DNA-directed RNA polymerase specialized sigma24 family protein
VAALSRAFADQLDDAVQMLPSLTTSEQEKVIAEVLRDLRPHAQRWSVRLCYRNGDVYQSHGDDVVSEALIAIWDALRSIAAGERQVANAYAYLYGVAVIAVGAYFRSTAATGLSGQVSMGRRHRRFSYLSERITVAEDRPATAAEIATAFNRQTHERLTNPRKERVVTEAEVSSWMAERDGTVIRRPARGALAA